MYFVSHAGSRQQLTARTGRRSKLSQSDKNSQSHSTETLSSAHRNRSSLNLGCHDTSGTCFSRGLFPTSVVQTAEPLNTTALSAAEVLLPRFLSYCFCTACCCSFSWLTSSSAYTLKSGTGSCNKGENKPLKRGVNMSSSKGRCNDRKGRSPGTAGRGSCDWVLLRG